MSLVLSGTDGVQDNSGAFTRGTAVTASGTSVTFAVPAWVKRITFLVSGLSYAGSGGQGRVQIGTGSTLATTGYVLDSLLVTGSNTCNVSSATNGVGLLNSDTAGDTSTSTVVIHNISGNTWVSTFTATRSGDGTTRTGTSRITLAGALDIVAVVDTTGTFDAGTINVLFE